MKWDFKLISVNFLNPNELKPASVLKRFHGIVLVDGENQEFRW